MALTPEEAMAWTEANAYFMYMNMLYADILPNGHVKGVLPTGAIVTMILPESHRLQAKGICDRLTSCLNYVPTYKQIKQSNEDYII